MSRLSSFVRRKLGLRLAPPPILKERPWLSDGAVAFLEDFLSSRRNASVLEFGAGSSTVWLASRVGLLVSVEHDHEWHGVVTDRLKGCVHVDVRRRRRPYFAEANSLADAS